MKKLFKITFLVVLALVLLYAAFSVASAIFSRDAGIGFIGGADGPTAILVSRSPAFASAAGWLLAAGVGLLILTAIAWLIAKNRRR